MPNTGTPHVQYSAALEDSLLGCNCMSLTYRMCTVHSWWGYGRTRFFGPLDPEDEGTTIFRNVGNYLPADLDIQ